MRTINPWINFNGNAEEAFTFYKSVFGGQFAKIVRLRDLSSAEFRVPDNEAKKIMHIVYYGIIVVLPYEDEEIQFVK